MSLCFTPFFDPHSPSPTMRPGRPAAAVRFPPAAPMISLDADKLRLTDFMDLPTLQEIQDSFAAVANVKATITDADGNLLTQPTPTKEFLRRQKALAEDEETQATAPEGPSKEGAEY